MRQPFDGMMIGAALLFERDPPRIVRSMVEKWVPRLPFVSVAMARIGQIVGTPDNCRRLLTREEAILVFPEGARGISNTFDKRYRLERFGHGFMRLALETRTPIVPVIGAAPGAVTRRAEVSANQPGSTVRGPFDGGPCARASETKVAAATRTSTARLIAAA